MERILIIGCSGSGKSTLAHTLGQRLGLPVVHLDQLWWREGWQSVSPEEFDQQLAAELQKPRWVIDGDFSRTLPQRLAACDTVVYLDYSRWVCLARAIKRVLTNYGHVRPDMSAGCPEQLDFEFLAFIWSFNKKRRTGHYSLLAGAKNQQVVVLRSPKATREFLQSI